MEDEWDSEDPASQRATEEASSMIIKKKNLIGLLKNYLKKLELHMVAKRPISREQLPPIDGININGK